MSKYAIGIDYGTLSVRALLVDIETGKEVAASIYEYPHGVMEEQDVYKRQDISSRWEHQKIFIMSRKMPL